MLVRLTGIRMTPSVLSWKKPTITINAMRMPYSRMCWRMKSPGDTVSTDAAPRSSCAIAILSPIRLDAHMHDFFLGRLGRRQLADELAFAHDDDAVAHAEQLRHLRGNENNAFAGGGQLVDDRVDLIFRADVDAARRLVQDQHLGVGEQPFRQHDLLLIA